MFFADVVFFWLCLCKNYFCCHVYVVSCSEMYDVRFWWWSESILRICGASWRPCDRVHQWNGISVC